VTSGRGMLKAHGVLALGPGFKPKRFTLKAEADRYKLGVGPVANATYSGAMKVEGAVRGNTLGATVALDDTVFRMQALQDQRKLHSVAPLPDVVYVDDLKSAARQSAGRPAAPMGLRLDVKAGTLFVRGEELDLEAHADLRVRTDARGRPRIKGVVGVRRGWVRVLNQKYEVKRARVMFSNGATPDPALDVVVQRVIGDVTVIITLTGTASAPHMELAADPALYDRAQILAMILTGNASVRDASGTDQGMAVASALTQALLGSFTRKVLPMVGLDVARVSLAQQKGEQGEEGGIRAETELGKYITQRLYVGYRHVFGAEENENMNEAIMEYAISVRWLLLAIFGDAGVGGLDLFWTYRY